MKHEHDERYLVWPLRARKGRAERGRAENVDPIQPDRRLEPP